jgi:hypothetical protein
MSLSHVQLSLDGTADVPVYARDEVLAFDGGQTTNAERVVDLHRLGYLPEPVLDPTFGLGGMWQRHRPARLVGCDLDAERARDVRCSFLALPFRDNAFASCLFDPPYKLTGDSDVTGKQGDYADLATRFDTNASRTAWLSVGPAIAECSRVVTSVLIVKCQDQVVTSWYSMQTKQVLDIATALGWRIAGQLHLVSYVSQPAGTRQINIRNNYSTFMVFKR